jgi:diketogulonate reductase-like aldo/keto reductase
MNNLNKLSIHADVSSVDASIPKMGLGTYKMDHNDLNKIIPLALEMGIRHIDTAQMYGNEAAIGDVLSKESKPREELFITTKLWHTNLRKANVIQSFHVSLKKLKTDYIDLLLIHWPNVDVPLEETLKAMHTLVEDGKVRFIGVSNFNPRLFKKAIDVSEEPIVTNQVEYHPFINQDALLDVAEKNQSSITAYRPIAGNLVSSNNTLREIGNRYDKEPSQIALRWLMQQKDVIAIPKTSNPKHLEKNLNIYDFELNEEEMIEIKKLTNENIRQIDPGFAEW